jgi:hypothetical protein
MMVQRRALLQAAVGGGAGLVVGSSFWSRLAAAEPAVVAAGPYGPLGPPDANGIRIPEGFRSRLVAESLQPVAGAPLVGVWHVSPDGAATFAADDGGWLYVCNSEAPVIGGVNALRFDADGNVVDGYPILRGTSQNCAGGPTPWGTWLSCEEFDLDDVGGPAGQVWECDPSGPGQGIARPALGQFSHEAVAVDPVNHHLYLTEDQGDGLLYRFTPSSWRDGAGVLDAGVLEAALVADDGQVTWQAVPDPSATSGPTRRQVPDATRFDGGEGAWFDDGTVYLTTKGDKRVWALDTATQQLQVIYDASPIGPDEPVALTVDNVTVSPVGDVFVAEDSGDRKRVLLLAEVDGVLTASPFIEVVERDTGSELTGPVFDPGGGRFYFSSQRGASMRDGETEIGNLLTDVGLGAVTDELPFDPLTHRGITYEITGPFRASSEQPPASAAAPANPVARATSEVPGRPSGSNLPATGGSGWLLAGVAATLGAIASRRLRPLSDRHHPSG